ncbi:rhodanese-like domain-containing protein [Haloarchaeobius sp. HME9146]|uniref:rhodanese-like domain-containing protein n=1 Tax=Haloarchaeobius sp. HME9146 TaxID=2978732 RepID=UPI0021C0794E|nr:rhodanese-like domain-containing protein [Haloarchaeobius sp. HME9146]MCT9097627.1 rhodanese-like domain-containing protein [Haloarchaeobius sp. HME9146]
MSKLRPDELDARLDGQQPFLLDIRPREAYQTENIDGSYNLPVYDDLRSGDEDALRQRLDEVPRDRQVVTVCKMGVIAKEATRILDDEGYEVTTLAGGMSGWRGYQNGTVGYRLRSLLWRLF